MPYKTPKRNGRKGESEFALAVKLCWFIYQFENPNKPIPLKKFCDEFEEIVNRGQILQILADDYGICWDFYNKDNSICKPNYDTARKAWKPKYKWKEEYPIFKSDRLMETDNSEMEKYIRQKSFFNRKDSEVMRTCYEKEDDFKAIEEESGKDMTYYRNKNNETISTAEERWRKRLGLDKEDNTKDVETITIPDNPEHEEQNIRDIWTKRARSDVIPR